MTEALIERMDADGTGITAEGRRVPFALPGEVLRLDGETATLVAPSAHRTDPACRHFGTCGGCAMQHVSDAFLGEWKRDRVARALAARGLAASIALAPAAPPGSRRRAVFAGRRTKKTTVVGFHARRSDAVFDLLECPLIRPELVAAKPALAAIARAGATRARPLRMLVTHGPAGLDLDARDGRSLDAALRTTLAGLAETHDLARLAWDGETLAQRRPPLQPFGSARVVPPPGAFLQPTTEGAAALTAAVAAALDGAARIADLFAGCGTFALPLAQSAAVHAVEGDAAMLTALDAGWRANPGLKRISTEARDLFRRPLLPSELDAYAGVVLDPPRAGAEAQARALAASRVPRIAAISCNPVSFARDAAILVAGGYRLETVTVVDQFRWSAHTELVARFAR